MGLFNIIQNEVSKFNVSVNISDDVLTIVNNENNNKLFVYREEYFSQDMSEKFVEYIVTFSTQHCHFDAEDSDEIIEYIRSIFNDMVLPLEFYLDGERRFGGEIRKEDFDKLSISVLSEKFGYMCDYLLQFDYEIHSWSGEYDIGLKHVSDLRA